jgi:hypothetical protein
MHRNEVRFVNNSKGNIRELTPNDIGKKYSKKKLLSSSVILPSQQHSYSLCTEFIRDWFLSKFNKDYFTNVHVDGKLSFDDFRRFSSIDDKLKRVNPIVAITPSIESEYTRDWIDSNAEGPLQSLRRTKMEGRFFSDYDKETHIALQFKSIKMNFAFKMRVNTRAEQLDLYEFVKTNHRCGYTENHIIALDVHVPKQIIAQVAHDVGMDTDDNLNVKEPYKLLKYLNEHSLLPFLYKFRCSNANNEFFIKVPNCNIHLKIEMPSKDDGERVGIDSTNYMVEFSVEAEMTAPMSYIYYSMHRMEHISDKTICSDGLITVSKSVVTDISDKNPDGWDLFATTDYLVENEDMFKCIDIDMREYLCNTNINDVLQYTIHNNINPAVFLDFKFYINGRERAYSIDWNTLQCHIKEPIDNLTTVIAVYIDKRYLNEVLINLENMNSSRI